MPHERVSQLIQTDSTYNDLSGLEINHLMCGPVWDKPTSSILPLPAAMGMPFLCVNCYCAYLCSDS